MISAGIMSKVIHTLVFVHILLFFSSTKFIFCAAVSELESAFVDDCGETDATILNDIRGSAPWTVAISQLGQVGSDGETTPKFLQTGVIVRPSVVLTVFEVSDQGWYVINGERVDVTTLIVDAGTESSGRRNFDENSQQYYIDMVIPFANPAHEKFQLVLLKVQLPLDLTGPFSRQICVPLNRILPALKRVAPEQVAVVPGFISDPSVNAKGIGRLQLHLLAQGDGETCARKFREAYLGKAEVVPCTWQWPNLPHAECRTLTKGSLLSLQYKGRKYLKGMAGLISMKKTSCTLFFYDFLQMDANLRNRLLQAITCVSSGKMSCPSGECIPSEKICNHQKDCDDGSGQDEEPILCRHLNPANSTFFCGFNDAAIPLTKVCDGKRDCHSGADELPIVCLRNNEGSGAGTPSTGKITRPSAGPVVSGPKHPVSHCPLPQYPKGVRRTCTKDGNDIPCENIVKGTKLRLSCQSWYVPSSSRRSSVEMTCNEDGSWAPFKPFSCQAVCGRLDIGLKNQQAYISFGNQVSRSFAFPWHVALFFWDRKMRRFRYGCGGSLIENSFILTAAHCVMQPSGAKKDRRTIMVVLAAVSSVLEENTAEEGSVIIGVDDFWVPPTYDVYSLTSDIALVKLNGSVDYTQDIQPVCYLNENSARPKRGELGLAAGFGKQETGIVSESLRWAGFPVIADEQCSYKLGVSIAANEFCAGFQNGTAVCEGDSGGGLVFKQFAGSEQSPYLIKGIVSRGISQRDPSCSVNEVAIFTHVDSFGSWLLDMLSTLDVF